MSAELEPLDLADFGLDSLTAEPAATAEPAQQHHQQQQPQPHPHPQPPPSESPSPPPSPDSSESHPNVRSYYTLNGASMRLRPSMETLLLGTLSPPPSTSPAPPDHSSSDDEPTSPSAAPARRRRRVGMWEAVVMRSLLGMLGVITYLRLSTVYGTAGVLYATLIVLLCGVVAALTSFSLSAMVTNGAALPGGVYVLTSRSLGPEFGGAIALVFACANAVAVALYCIGFADGLDHQLRAHGHPSTDPRVYALGSLVLVAAMSFFGISKYVQRTFCAVLVLSLVGIFVGVSVNSPDASTGFESVSSSLLRENMGPSDDFDFFFALSIFFPAMTGFMSSSNATTDIRKPHKAIPRGMLYAIGISTVVNVALGWVLAASADRALGLIDNEFIIVAASVWSPLAYAGIYAATLSSAVVSLNGAPKLVYAVASDHLIPALEPCARVTSLGQSYREAFGVRNAHAFPYVSYLVCMSLAALCICLGSLDEVAAIDSSLYIVTYAAVNLACFAASHSNTPGWRPTFRFYNKWVAFGASLLCLSLVFLLSSFLGLVALALGIGIYKFIEWKDVIVSYASARDASRVKAAIQSLVKLEKIRSIRDKSMHVLNYRPHILTLSGLPAHRPDLVLFSRFMTRARGIMLYGHVRMLPEKVDLSLQERMRWHQANAVQSSWSALDAVGLAGQNAFYKCVTSPSLCTGVRNLIELGGPGPLGVNCLLLGYPEHWRDNGTDEFVQILRQALMMHVGVMVARSPLTHAPSTRGTIDIWWFFDDGGLTLLIPHLISMHKQWRGRARIRIMNVATSAQLSRIQVEMARLIRKLRIKAEVVTVDLSSATPGDGEPDPVGAMYAELTQAPSPSKRTRRTLNHARLVQQHSRDAHLIVMTMPVCSVDVESSHEFVTWLECLSAPPLPSVLFVRGNQEAVLSFEL